MRFNVMVEPQEGATYSQLVAVATRAEELGFEGFFRSDHYSSVRGVSMLGSTDAWATLAGLARDTQRIRLGTLMSPITWRHPVVLAKTVTTVDEMSGGRIELGIGTGWQPLEHQMYGFPFEDFTARFRWLEESLRIILALWTEDSATVQGKTFSVRGAEFVPKPVQKPHPPILIGGVGQKKTPMLAARYAQEWNATGLDPKTYAERRARLFEECEKIGRDPSSIVCSLMTGVFVGRDQRDFEERASLASEQLRGDPDWKPLYESLRTRWIVGPVEEAAERLAAYADAGCQRVMFQLHVLDDLDHLDVIWRDLRPKVV